MTAAEHLARAIELAEESDREDDPMWAIARAVQSMASAALAHELWICEGDPIPGPVEGAPAPVLSLPMRPDKRKAAADAPATADQHDPSN